MVALSSTFEGGTDGVTITTGNSGGASGTAFDLVAAITDQTIEFDNARSANGTMSAKFATVLTDGAWVQWTTSTLTGATQYGRLYFYATAVPGTSLDLVQYRNASTGVARIRHRTDGKLSVIVGSTVAATTTTSVSLNQWVRLEWKFTLDIAGAGVAEAKLFNSSTSSTATETITATSQTFPAASADSVRLGVAVNQPTIGPFWLDDLTVNNTGYPGPSSGTAPGQVLAPAANITVTGWTINGAGSAVGALSEASPDDTTYATSPATPTASVLEVKFDPGVDPLASTGHVLSYRIRTSSATSSSVVVGLYQGTTLIASETRTSVPSSFTTYSLTLSGAQADAITNYSDLRIRFTATAS